MRERDSRLPRIEERTERHLSYCSVSWSARVALDGRRRKSLKIESLTSYGPSRGEEDEEERRGMTEGTTNSLLLFTYHASRPSRERVTQPG